MLQRDFEDNALYKAAHVFFTSSCPDELFYELRHSSAASHICTLREINLSFVPYESRVFTLDYDAHMFTKLFNCVTSRQTLEDCADKLATLFVTLGGYPKIVFRTDNEGLNLRFATVVKQKLDWYKGIDSKMDWVSDIILNDFFQ